MGKYDHLTREELIERLEMAELSETAKLRDRLDGEQRLAKALVLMLQNYNGNYEEDIMRIVLERYKADRAFLFQFDWRQGVNNNLYEVCSAGIEPKIQTLQRLPNAALSEHLEKFRQGHPLVVNDVATMPDTVYQGPLSLKQVFQELNLKSAILFPMHIFNELWGFVGMETVHHHRIWSNDDIEWLKAFTNVLNIGVSQKHIRIRAEHNERKFSELFSNMPIGYIHHRIIYDKANHPVDYEFLEANPAFEQLTGLKKEQCIGKTASQIKGILDKELFQSYVKVATKSKLLQFDYASPLLGKWFHCVLYSPRKDEFISLFYDITEKIKTTEKIKQNEKNLRTIFDNLPVGTISFDQDRRYINANLEAFRMFGITPAFNNDLILTSEEEEELKKNRQLEYDFIYDPVQRQLLSGEEELPDTAVFSTTKIIMYTDDQDQCSGYLLIAVDNSKIQRTNRQLSKTEKALTENLVRLSLILETGEIYPWYMDLETGELDISEDFYKFFGLNEKQRKIYSVEKFMKHIHPDDLKIFLGKYESLQKGLIQRISIELRMNINEKGYIWCEINAGARSRGKNSSITKWLGFLTIIQKRKDNEAQLVEALKKAEESDKLKSAFLANVSHEIRTPLNAIVGFSELIANTEDTEDKNYYLDIVKTNNNLLLNLINDILDLSKIESGRIDLTETAVNVEELCREICHVHQMKAPPEVKVIFDNTCPPLIVLTDRNRLLQLYSNLVSNAIKNTVAGSITVGYKPCEKEVEFYVRDTGKGIPKDKQTIIFNRFEKLHSNAQGFGLGLSICKSILEKMEGSIRLTSEEGKGSEFRFTLPYKTATLKQQNIPAELPSTSSKQHASEFTILVAEDIDSNYELLKALYGKKYNLLWAQNGIEAINLFSTEHPDLILMDMQMPELSGIEAAQIIREVSPDIPIIALTAYSYESDKEAALAAGCNELVTKPFHTRHLESILDKYLITPRNSNSGL